MIEKRIRVLHALGSMNPGGVENWLLQVLRHIDRRRFEFGFCTFGPEPGLLAPEAEGFGGKILRCPRDTNLWTFPRRFRRILRVGRYDIVHSHVTLFSGAILRWANAEGVPVRIAHSHTSNDDRPASHIRRYYQKLMKRWIDRYATHGLAASRPSAAQLFGELWRQDPRFQVLHCGIDLHPFAEDANREEVRRELGIPANAKVVGHVGRFVAAKNHEFFLRVAQEIVRRHPDVHFLLVGDGPLRPATEAQAKAFGIHEKTHFTGMRTDVSVLMRGAMDVLVFPSQWEGLPVTVIEAQAAGLRAVVSASVTKEAEIIPEQITWMSLEQSAEKWAAKTIAALDERRIEPEASAGAVQETDFCVEQSASSLMDFYIRAVEPCCPVPTAYAEARL